VRNLGAKSAIEDLPHVLFLPVLPDTEVSDARRILICTGKIGHELRMERQRRKDNSTAVLFVEQLYPFAEQELADAIQQHASARDSGWVQNGPANRGAFFNRLARPQHLSGGRVVPCPMRLTRESANTHQLDARLRLRFDLAETIRMTAINGCLASKLRCVNAGCTTVW